MADRMENEMENRAGKKPENQMVKKMRSWMETCRERIQEPGRYFPPGYEYETEGKAAGTLLGIGIVLSLQFFAALYRERGRLRCLLDADSARVWPETVARPFLELLRGHLILYAPFLLFLLGMTVCHYLYYYRGTKSIYVMRRLPRRGILWRSCVMGPLLGALPGALILVLLYLLYFGIYLLAIPAECLPRFA